MDIELLEKLLNSLKKHLDGVCEFTVETNPESLNSDKISLFLDKGVNRISIGAQSFNDDKLKSLGRAHNSILVKNAIELAVNKGISNISIDMIFGIWNENADIWKNDLEKVSDFPITHISCYSLTYEKNTPLKKAVEEGRIIPLEEEKAADMYQLAACYLSGRGFDQYEVSNFAKKNFSCRHNMAYWENEPYVGIGASAVSYIDGVRQENISDIAEYIDKINKGQNVVISSEKLTAEKRARETAALKIRTREGINFDWFVNKTGIEFLDLNQEALSGLMKKGLVEHIREEGVVKGICLTHKGILYCDIVSSAFL